MTELVFFLEERSAKLMLEGFLPSILPEDENIYCRYVVFEGKSDLQKNLFRKLKAWQNNDAKFIVLHDKDSNDCMQIKEKLTNICQSSGKSNTLVRIACHELESWYLGDLLAVERGLGLFGLERQRNNRKFRTPDNIGNAFQELSRLTRDKYQKISGSRSIAPYLDIERNQSRSFRVFVEGVRGILSNN